WSRRGNTPRRSRSKRGDRWRTQSAPRAARAQPRRRRRPVRSAEAPRRGRSCGLVLIPLSRVRPFEESLPLLEQRLQLVAGAAVLSKRLDVVPVLGELPLELGHGLLARGDLRLDSLELRGALRFRRRHLAHLRRGLRLGCRYCRHSPRLALADVLRPTPLVRGDAVVLRCGG